MFSYNLIFFFKYMHWVWGIESDVRGRRGHKSFHLHVVVPFQKIILIYFRNKEEINEVFIHVINEVALAPIISEITLLL